MSGWRAAVSAALFLWGWAFAATAQDVTLTSQDGAVTINGTLLGFDGEFYRVATTYGELTVDGSGVQCDGVGCPNLGAYVARMRLSGSAVIAERVMPLLVEAFARASGFRSERSVAGDDRVEYALFDPREDRVVARFTFRASTTEEGFADLLADEADVVMALRAVRLGEVRLARDAGLGDLREANRSRVLALDGLVPIVAPGNPLDTISLPDLARVLAGEIDNWAQLGGEDAPIEVYVPAPGTGLAQSMTDRVLSPARARPGPDVVTRNSNRELVTDVSGDALALGIASYANLGNAKPLTLTGRCGFSLAASRQTIKTEDYPLTAPMFLYLPARRLPKLARDFLAYTRSPLAQIVIRRAGLVDQAPEEIPWDAQGDRLVNAVSVAGTEFGLPELQEMVATLAGRKRLSISFRFEVGSSRLDAQSNSNVQQLARALEAGRYDTRDLLFAGFSDGNGDAKANRRIAQSRADAVLRAVRDAAETADFSRLALRAASFGEMMPMACDDTSWGRSVNRRVEVWLK
ncbi:phosphate ABC transporter substrate-binding/OmpA family protein [Pseudaestuariivita atlantica]|uniref:Cell envelope biogenesis protein OmpA n=1 Tax=Pseudaestuariivita atlantica TaxID=1317121 RepID=A0A0L1JNJ1_9RHOB|nr:phosphate ABC transporter substrate-binding/OmpA family protein [Pseudaestuariivita atlantica]KNG93335.1 cell envelope biogenesis protein OmpA [Pseudaestuariivita atlantica]